MHEIPAYQSAQHVADRTAVDILWRQLGTLQSIAEEYGITNIFQDNGAEILQQLVYLNFAAVPGREGNDGVDSNGCEWEMKSLDISKGNKGITTNHHLNETIIQKYETVPWSVSIYDGIQLQQIYIIGPEQLAPMFAKWREKLQTVQSINNPKIPLQFIRDHGFCIYDHNAGGFPLNPIDIIDTRQYVAAQREHAQKHKKIAGA